MNIKNGCADKKYIIPEYRKTRKLYIAQGMLSNSALSCYTGAILTGYLAFLGINSEIIAIMMQIPLLAAAVQIFAPLYYEKRSRRLPTMRVLELVSRGSIIFMSFVVMGVANVNARIVIMSGALLVGYMCSHFSVGAWQDFMANITPLPLRMRYVAMRDPLSIVGGTLLGFGTSFVLDYARAAGHENVGFIIIYITAAFFVAVEGFVLFRMKEPAFKRKTEKLSLKKVFTLPLKNKRYLRYIIYYCGYNFGVQFCASYYSIYLVKELKIPFFFISLLTFLATSSRLATAKVINTVASRVKPITLLCGGCALLGVNYAAWFFTTPSNAGVLLVFLNIIAAAALTSIAVANFYANVACAPEQSRTVYFAFSNCIGPVVGFVASLCGAAMNGILGGIALPFSSMKLLFLADGGIMLLVALYAATVLKKTLKEVASGVDV